MKPTRLAVEYDYDFEIFALISSAKPHKLAWSINKTFNIHLRKAEDLCLDFIKESKIIITNFLFETEYGEFRLLKNRPCEMVNASRPFLLPELKDYDYIIKSGGEAPLFPGNDILDNLRNLPEIQYVQQIEVINLKSKENLIF